MPPLTSRPRREICRLSTLSTSSLVSPLFSSPIVPPSSLVADLPHVGAILNLRRSFCQSSGNGDRTAFGKRPVGDGRHEQRRSRLLEAARALAAVVDGGDERGQLGAI